MIENRTSHASPEPTGNGDQKKSPVKTKARSRQALILMTFGTLLLGPGFSSAELAFLPIAVIGLGLFAWGFCIQLKNHNQSHAQARTFALGLFVVGCIIWSFMYAKAHMPRPKPMPDLKLVVRGTTRTNNVSLTNEFLFFPADEIYSTTNVSGVLVVPTIPNHSHAELTFSVGNISEFELAKTRIVALFDPSLEVFQKPFHHSWLNVDTPDVGKQGFSILLDLEPLQHELLPTFVFSNAKELLGKPTEVKILMWARGTQMRRCIFWLLFHTSTNLPSPILTTPVTMEQIETNTVKISVDVP